MRIAMLAPITRRVPPRPYGPEEELISDLTEGLVERGHRVTLFATANSLTRAELVAVCPKPLVEWGEDPWPDPRWWEDLHISECATRAARGDFDIIHNHLHAKALPFMTSLHLPVLTTLHGEARDQQINSVLLRFREFPFVAMDAEEKSLLPELNYVAEIPFPVGEEPACLAPLIDQYEALYTKLVSGALASPSSEARRLTPWGAWEVLRVESNFKVKRIQVNPGHRLSYQRHQRRREHWVVVMGQAEVVLGGKTMIVTPGEAVDILEGLDHRIGNPGEVPLVFIEIQRGDYFGEDDIERLSDDYGRS